MGSSCRAGGGVEAQAITITGYKKEVAAACQVVAFVV